MSIYYFTFFLFVETTPLFLCVTREFSGHLHNLFTDLFELVVLECLIAVINNFTARKLFNISFKQKKKKN